MHRIAGWPSFALVGIRGESSPLRRIVAAAETRLQTQAPLRRRRPLEMECDGLL